MIVRIAAEGQFELSDDQAGRLNEIDNAVVEAVDAQDDARFHELWAQMIEFVEREGRPVANDDLKPSDVILPPRDISLAEAASDFSGDGLIPG